MSRPVKDRRVKRNGDSVQVVENGVVVGTLSLSFLCRLVRVKNRYGTKRVLAQLDNIKEGVVVGGSGTN